MLSQDTIVASATAPGRGAISVIRLSGPQSLAIAEQLSGKTLKPRTSTYGVCGANDPIDTGLWFYYPGPASFTGEEVCEFQGHGGPVVIQAVLQHMIALGARLARPGEFSERAFLNQKIDLAQAEAIADLIAAASIDAVKAANRSLSGEFGAAVQTLVEQLIRARVQIEAHLDFPDEDISPHGLESIQTDINKTVEQLEGLLVRAERGSRLNHATDVVLIGPPNAGKSSLLNRLAEEPLAIVTDIPGTTRDLIRHHIVVDGLELRITDTAGIRHDVVDPIEQEGILRTRQAITQADLVILLYGDPIDRFTDSLIHALINPNEISSPIMLVQNKSDLLTAIPDNTTAYDLCVLSAKTGDGLDELFQRIKAALQITGDQDVFLARTRHVQLLQDALAACRQTLLMPFNSETLDLIAEDLRVAQTTLSEITGRFSSDDLLGEIFSTFCIGK